MMDIKSIAKNIKTKGISSTIKSAKFNDMLNPRYLYWLRKCRSNTRVISNLEKKGKSEDAQALIREEFPKAMYKGIGLLIDAKSSTGKKILSKLLKEQEELLKKNYKALYKEYNRNLRQIVLKQEIPAIYEKESHYPLENKVIFMENGNSPSPSSARLAEAIKEQGRYEVVYIGLHIRKVSDIEYYQNAKEFIKELSTAKALFLSTANDLLSQFDLRPETKVIQLWHGVGMFKKVGYSTADNTHFGKSAKAREEYNQYRNYTAVTVASEDQIWTFEDAFRISRESGIYRSVGIARTDVFYNEKYRQDQLNKLYEEYPQCKGKRLILYAPTFRGVVVSGKAPDKLDVQSMSEKLSKDYMLLIKHHGVCKEVPKIPDSAEGSFAIDLSRQTRLTIDGLLAIADILITDYSSVAFEYSIRENPMIFFAYDLDDYMDKRGMYYDYEDITPGPVCKETSEIVDYIANLDEKFDLQVVKDFRQKYVGACDGHAIERTIALIEE